MARPRSRTLTEVELDIMHVIWAKEEASTEDVMRARSARGRPLSDGATRTMLAILVDKGYLTRRRGDRGAFLYTAKVPRDQARRKMVADLLKRAFAGSAAGMVAAIMNTRSITEKDIREIERLIAQHRKEEKRK